MRGAAIRARIDGEKDIALAHTIASFSRAKKLERRDHYLRPRGRRKATLLDRHKAIPDRTRTQCRRRTTWNAPPTVRGRRENLVQIMRSGRGAGRERGGTDGDRPGGAGTT